MGEIKYVFGLLFCLLFFITGKGQSVPNEVLLNKTFCELKNMSISCESNETFAFESLNFYYHPDCGNQCCSYNSSHSSVGADGNDIQMILRECSGRRHCSLNISRMQFFEPSLKTPSYAALHYYCIPGNRTTSICANEVLESSGLPLYFTNENYPSVTTGSGICSCSIEINSCTSDVTMSILDLDLYHEQETCEQNIELRNGMGDMLEILHCGDYSNKSMDVGDLRSHYLKINFINNSTNNLEGLFLIGFTASEENVSFSLSCPSKRKTVCLQCEDTINIPNGKIVLQDVNNTREGALANITCDTGYEPDKFTIKCLKSGYWDNATCLPKECKEKINITNGDIVLHDGNNTREGALANITCDTGYEPDKLTIKCLKDGYWDNATCLPKECKDKINITNGDIVLHDGNNTREGALANITCDTGYEPDKLTIKCLQDGYWDNATCLPKGCEDEIKIPNGDMVLHDDNDIKKGASANITCHTGYVTDKHVIKCSEHGEWEKVTCHLIDCGNVSDIKNGKYTLNDENNTTFGAMANVICDVGYESDINIITCSEKGNWSYSFCTAKENEDSENDGKTGTIIAAIVIPVVIINLLILGLCCFIKYRRQGYLLRSFSTKSGHESVSFKNKEVLPEEDQGQITNLVFSNETENQEGHQSTESKEPQDKEESHQEEKKCEESNIPLKKVEQGGNLNDDVKNEEAEQCQKSVETNVNSDQNLTGQNSNATSTIHKNSDHKEDNKSQEANKTSDTSMADQNEDVKSPESKGTDETSKNDIKEEIKSQTPGETSQICADVPKEVDVKDRKSSETNEASKTDQNEDGKGQKSSEIIKNDAKKGEESQTPGETSMVNTNEPTENVKGQETINTNEENKSEGFKVDIGQASK